MRLLYNKAEDKITDTDYEDMQANIDSSPPGANGVRIYVSQNDLMRKRDLEGINLLNMSLQTSRGDVFRAVMEYLSFTDSQQLVKAERKKKMYIMGGLVKNKSYAKIRASIMNMPQFIPDEQEINSLGAALLGGLGAGLYSSYEEAADNVALHFEKVPVDPRLAAEYRRIYGIGQD
jgi:xylulokinase